MEYVLLIASTACYLMAFAYTAFLLQKRGFRRGRFDFFAVGLGFLLQTAFLSVRGHALGRCPLTNLFEVFIFLAWSLVLIYMATGPAYRD